jgi:probable F420-dependent oxidoreductase
MRWGVDVPNEGDLPLELGVTAMARAAEEAGAVSLWANEHVLMVDSPDARYPYRADGRIPWSMDRKFFDPLTTCAFMAAVTERCRVGTDVLILPQRHALHLANAVACLDVLSGGRVALGVGLGWFRQEMEALGFDFATRGRRADEMIEVLRRCFTGRPEPFQGETLSIGPGIVMEPRPATEAGPPILVGGMTPPACRRAGRLGDGWMGVANVDDLERELPTIQACLEALAQAREAAGRAEEPFELVMKLHTPLQTWPDATIAAVRHMAELGFDEVIVQPFWESVEQGVACLSALEPLPATPIAPTVDGARREPLEEPAPADHQEERGWTSATRRSSRRSSTEGPA